MKMKSLLLITTLLAFVAVTTASAQPSKPRQSPKSTATGKIGDATISITYSSPSVKGRKIWGDLVPFDKVWRAGANEATIVEIDKDVMVEGKKLPAGKYSLYAIPSEKEWQIIFNSQIGQWGIERTGETTRKPEKDVLIVAVKPKQSSKMEESLIFTIHQGFSLKWENLDIAVTIK